LAKIGRNHNIYDYGLHSHSSAKVHKTVAKVVLLQSEMQESPLALGLCLDSVGSL